MGRTAVAAVTLKAGSGDAPLFGDAAAIVAEYPTAVVGGDRQTGTGGIGTYTAVVYYKESQFHLIFIQLTGLINRSCKVTWQQQCNERHSIYRSGRAVPNRRASNLFVGLGQPIPLSTIRDVLVGVEARVLATGQLCRTLPSLAQRGGGEPDGNGN